MSPDEEDREMISCKDALAAVYEYLDGELHGEDEGRVQAHFEVCARCYPHLRLEESFREVVRRAGSGPEAPAALKARIQALLSGASEP